MRLDELDVFKIEVSTATRQRHLSAVTTALAQRRSHRSVRRLPLILAATVVLIPLAAWASESSIPGDVLHPIKRFLEPAWGLFDDEVRARHRLDELEALIELQAPPTLIDQQLVDAEAAVGDNPLLLERLAALKEDLAREPISDEMRPTTTTTTTTTTTATTTTVATTARAPAPEPTTTAPLRTAETTTTTASTRGTTRP
jgi:hypothetical protein